MTRLPSDPALVEIKEIVKTFVESSEKQSKRMFWLTIAIIIFAILTTVFNIIEYFTYL